MSSRSSALEWILAACVAAFLLFLALIAGGCGSSTVEPGQLMRGANDVLAVLCSTREALTGAKEMLDRGDVVGAVELLKAYMIEHGHDREVAALLELLEAQLDKALVREPPVDWGF